MLVVMMLMTASSAMAEVIDGIRYLLESDTKTATLLPKMEGKYKEFDAQELVRQTLF